MKAQDYIGEAEEIRPVSDEAPGETFLDFYERNHGQIREILLRLKDGDTDVPGFTLRAGMMNPVNAVIVERIKEFCRLPYRTDEGSIASCPGILGNWKGCPPHSPAVGETIGLLSDAHAFLILQFDGREGEGRQGATHLFTTRFAESLRKEGFDILEAYSCGPCRLCASGCGESEECRQPERRLFALESCGFWVNSLCRNASGFPVCGGGPREVRWIKDWDLSSQDTESVRFVTGILLGADGPP